jgi:polar amino acid transport system substrate-binding protein
MKNILLSILIISSVSGIAQTTKLKLGSDVWPPFTNVDNEKSFALDLVKEALNRIDIQSSTEILSFDEVISAIDRGDIDGSAALWLNAEREQKYIFSKPYLHNQLILVGRKGSAVKDISIADLDGKRVGVVENYAYGDPENPNVIIVEGKSDQKNLERLLSKQIDYMLVDDLLIQYMLKYQINDVTEHLEIGNSPLRVKSLHFALRKDIKDCDQIIARFNEEIYKMIADGSYNAILELNWIESDIDGDGKMELVLQGDHAGTKQPLTAYSILAEEANNQTINNSYRYYIDGEIYEGWENIPDRYKIKVSPGQANPNNIGLIFSF